jgi:hypothetical protein
MAGISDRYVAGVVIALFCGGVVAAVRALQQYRRTQARLNAPRSVRRQDGALES